MSVSNFLGNLVCQGTGPFEEGGKAFLGDVVFGTQSGLTMFKISLSAVERRQSIPFQVFLFVDFGGKWLEHYLSNMKEESTNWSIYSSGSRSGYTVQRHTSSMTCHIKKIVYQLLWRPPLYGIAVPERCKQIESTLPNRSFSLT